MTNATKLENRISLRAKTRKVKLFTLARGEAASVWLSVAALPPEELNETPPKFDSFHLEEVIGWRDNEIQLLGGGLGLKRFKMRRPKLTALFGPQNYQVSATVKVEKRTIYVYLEGDKSYHWDINLQYTVYPPEETRSI